MMKWQEYQEAVGELYARMMAMGQVTKNVLIPDRITGQNRQVDVWWSLNLNGHAINILIDAKLRSSSIDVKDVEEVYELASAVKAHKSIIITNHGWTVPAMVKSNFLGMELKILSIEEALSLVVSNKWFMCYECKDECVVMDSDGVLYLEKDELFFDWYAGKCRKCKDLYIHCPQCGHRKILEISDEHECFCGHVWSYKKGFLFLKMARHKEFMRVDNVAKPSPEFVLWMLGYPSKYWQHALEGRVLTVGTDEGNHYSFKVNT